MGQNKNFDPMMTRSETEEMIVKLKNEMGLKGILGKSAQKRKADVNKNSTKKLKRSIDNDVVVVPDDDDESSQLIDPSWPGAEFVRDVKGFFCDACKKFIPRDEESAVEEHCNSITHKSKIKT